MLSQKCSGVKVGEGAGGTRGEGIASRGGLTDTLVALSRFDVYRRALTLARLVRQIDVRVDMRNQMVKAADSVVRNIAEGQGRSGGHRAQSFEIARGSLYETGAAFDLATLSLGETAVIAAARGGPTGPLRVFAHQARSFRRMRSASNSSPASVRMSSRSPRRMAARSVAAATSRTLPRA